MTSLYFSIHLYLKVNELLSQFKLNVAGRTNVFSIWIKEPLSGLEERSTKVNKGLHPEGVTPLPRDSRCSGFLPRLKGHYRSGVDDAQSKEQSRQSHPKFNKKCFIK